MSYRQVTGSVWTERTYQEMGAFQIGGSPPLARMPSGKIAATIAYISEAGPAGPNEARNEDLLTRRPTLAVPRLGHDA
jgi:hypothetical protein